MVTVEEIPMLPVTLRNEATIRPHYEAVRKYAQEKAVTATLRNVARLRQNDPNLANLIDEIGQPSQAWIDKQVALMIENDTAEREALQLDREPLSVELATKTARADHERQMRTYFTLNPEVGRKLYFDAGTFPATLDALKLGRGVVIACADYDALERAHGANTADLVRDVDGEMWMNATAAEVAAWVTRFCEVWQ